ncbi:MAG: aminotransferase class V-fold PLP-dependent enzyme, partial [Asticcacaulis sp.]
MAIMPLYLDHAATSPVRPEVREVMLAAWDVGANASSVHALGRKAKLVLEEARDTVLRAINGVGPARLVFTSGGTEANHLALRQARGFDRLIVSATEHDSIFRAASAMDLPVTVAPVLGNGLIDIAALEALLVQDGRSFVCVMRVNNETGVIQPVEDIAPLVKAADGWLHVSGQVAMEKGEIVGGGIVAENHKAIQNLIAILHEADYGVE